MWRHTTWPASSFSAPAGPRLPDRTNLLFVFRSFQRFQVREDVYIGDVIDRIRRMKPEARTEAASTSGAAATLP